MDCKECAYAFTVTMNDDTAGYFCGYPKDESGSISPYTKYDKVFPKFTCNYCADSNHVLDIMKQIPDMNPCIYCKHLKLLLTEDNKGVIPLCNNHGEDLMFPVKIYSSCQEFERKE